MNRSGGEAADSFGNHWDSTQPRVALPAQLQRGCICRDLTSGVTWLRNQAGTALTLPGFDAPIFLWEPFPQSPAQIQPILPWIPFSSHAFSSSHLGSSRVAEENQSWSQFRASAAFPRDGADLFSLPDPQSPPPEHSPSIPQRLMDVPDGAGRSPSSKGWLCRAPLLSPPMPWHRGIITAAASSFYCLDARSHQLWNPAPREDTLLITFLH
ncbi:hypothetical protein IHE44_0001847 [Lamprotornis superbus]|uniref:Uncharacterized protein n=1 Tax=Lamprotornis superbus TaxID=245042 RepID=A0A835NQ60_9PASS|nr:hypothetical protein IHE44_0001847 [Lamprotornis superbus]